MQAQQQQALQYQQQVQQAQMQAQQPPMTPQDPSQPPQAPQAPQVPPPPAPVDLGPTVEDVMGLLRDGVLRRFRIDIEADSTIVGDESQDRQDRNEFITVVAEFVGRGVRSSPATRPRPSWRATSCCSASVAIALGVNSRNASRRRSRSWNSRPASRRCLIRRYRPNR